MQLENVLREVEVVRLMTHIVIRAIILFQFLETRPQMQYGAGDWKVIICLLIFLQRTICLFLEHPTFFGSNPAVVLSGSEKGKYILKDEAELGFALLHSLNKEQMDKAIISNEAPGDILTAASRHAMISDPKGILYNELERRSAKNIHATAQYLYSSLYTIICRWYDERD